jgi:hypothetical protein
MPKIMIPPLLKEQFEASLKHKALPPNVLAFSEKITLTLFTNGGTQGHKYRFKDFGHVQRDSMAKSKPYVHEVTPRNTKKG